MEPSYHRITARIIILLAVGLGLASTAQAVTVTWTGTTNNDWNTGSNWSPAAVPTSSDDVVIGLDGATVDLPNGIDFIVNSLTLGGDDGGSVTILKSTSSASTVGFRLTVLGTVTIASDGHLNMQGSPENYTNVGDSLMVTGTITNDGELTFRRLSYISTAGLTNNNLLISDECYDQYGTNDIVGDIINSATGEIQIEGNEGTRHGNIYVEGDLTNSGLVYLHTTATGSGPRSADLNVSGTFTNTATGTFVDSSDTYYDATRSLTVGTFDNQGRFLARAQTFTNLFVLTTPSAAGTYTNSGHMEIGQTILINNVGSFTNTGTITIDTTKTLTLTGFGGAGTLVTENGEFHGNGTLKLNGMGLSLTRAFDEADSLSLDLTNNSTLTLTAPLTVGRTLTLSGASTISAPSITNNGTLNVSGITINCAVTNNDSMNVGYGTVINGSVTNAIGADLIVTSIGGSPTAELSVDGGITNHGYLELNPNYWGANTLISVTNGSLTNAATGTIQGATGYSNIYGFGIQANLVNEGIFESNFGMTIDGGSHSNGGTLRINQGAVGSYRSTHSRFTFKNGATLTNTGTVILDTATTLYMSSAAFTNTGTVNLDTTAFLSIFNTTYHGEVGTLEGTGTLSMSSVTGYLGQKLVVKDAGVKVSLYGGTVYVDSLINQATWTVEAPSVYADSAIINEGTLRLQGICEWDGPLVNKGTMIFARGASTIGAATLSGPVVNEEGQLIYIESSSQSSTVTVDSSFTNHGTLELRNISANNYGANLTVNKGWLINTGTINGLATGTVKADLDNQGTFNVAPVTTFTIEKDQLTILNSGTIHVSGGNTFQVDSLNSFVNSGTIQIDAGNTVQLYGPFVPSTGYPPTFEASFSLDGSGVLSNAGILETKYLSLNLGAKWTIGNSENVTLYYSRVATDSLINEGYLTMTNASISGEVVNRDTIVTTGYGAAFDSTLVNETGAYIKGGGTYLDVDSAFTNHGYLELTTTSTSAYGVRLWVKAGNLVNSPTGVINAELGVSTRSNPEHKLYANLVNQGTLSVDSAAVVMISGTSFNNESGGLVQGQGTLDVSSVAFINAGTIAPGGSPGYLTVDGDLTFGPTSVIDIEIEGDNPGSGYDQLNITGHVALAGSLQVILSYNPDEGKTFLPLIYGSSSGVFESLTTQGGGKFLSAHITDTGLYLTASISGGNGWPFIGRIADITAPEDTTLAITLQAFDPDAGDVLTFSAVSDTPAVDLAIVQDTLQITPQLNWNGTANIEVIVSDGNLKDTTEFVLTLTPVPDAPLAFDLTAPAKDSTVVIDQNNLNIQFYLQWTQADDPEGDYVRYSVVFTDSLELMPEKNAGGNTGVYWYLSEIKTAMESNGYATISGTWTILARDQQDTTYATNGPFNLTFVNGMLSIEDGEGLPTVFALHPAYPNPFNPSTTIKFDVPQLTNVAVIVYDLLGRKVITLASGPVQPGYHRVIWNGKAAHGSEVPTGMYIARLVTPDYTKSIKMLLLK